MMNAKSSGKPTATYKYDVPMKERSDILIHIIENHYRDGQCNLRAIAIDAENKHNLTGAKYKEMLVRDPRRLENAKKTVVMRVKKTLASSPPANRSPAARQGGKDLPGKTKYDHAFQYVVDHNVTIPGWNVSTRTPAFSWFRLHFLPLLNERFVDESITMITGPSIQQWKLEQTQSVMDSKRRKTELTVSNTMTWHYQQVKQIYDAMRQIDTSLPELDPEEFRTSGRRTLELEQCKSIPEDNCQRFWREIEAAVETEPRMAFGATLVASAGARTAEAAGTLPQDVEFGQSFHGNELFDGTFSVVAILNQESRNKRNGRLKTDNAYRLVPLPKWPTEILRRCIEKIGPLPDDKPLVTTDALSDWIMAKMTRCGLTRQYLEDLMQTESLFPDTDNAQMIRYDPISYIWRRNWVSILRNICGLTRTETDVISGHKTSKRVKWEKVELGLLQQLKRFAKKMERYVYSTDPVLTMNPAFRPYDLAAVRGTEYLIPFAGIRLRNTTNETLVLKNVKLQAREPSEVVDLRAPTMVDFVPYSESPKITGRIVIGNNIRRNAI